MATPRIADNKPVPVTVTAGQSYYFCACGHSSNQPFCDGSHAGTSMAPQHFVPEEDGEVWLCCCKRTGKSPYCDGSHKSISADEVGSQGGDAAGG